MVVVYYSLVFAIIALFGGSVIWGMWWALRGGQFSNFQEGAHSILDGDEVNPEPSDAFPGMRDEMEKELAKRRRVKSNGSSS